MTNNINLTRERFAAMVAPTGTSEAQNHFRVAYEFYQLEYDQNIEWEVPFDFDESWMQDAILGAVIENDFAALHCRSGYKLTKWNYNFDRTSPPLHIAFDLTFFQMDRHEEDPDHLGYVRSVDVPILALELELAVRCCADKLTFAQISESLLAIKNETPVLGVYYERACRLHAAKCGPVPVYDPTKSIIGQRFATVESMRTAMLEEFGAKQ